MKLVTYKKDDQTRIGIVTGDEVIDLSTASTLKDNSKSKALPVDMVSFLELGDYALQVALQVKSEYEEGERPDWAEKAVLPLTEVDLLAPVLSPGKILCVGLNYIDHAEETGQPIPEEPVIFGKYANAVIGPEEAVRTSAVSKKVDYEAELAVVIGKTARQVEKEYALEYIAGYVNFNDISARDLQGRDGQWMKGKISDTFAPMGPWMVTCDEITDPGNLDIELRLNGEVMQQSNTGKMIFNVAELVSFFSNLLTLEPGDIIATGTPSGVGFVRKPRVFLKPGDYMEIEVEHLGVLKNYVK